MTVEAYGNNNVACVWFSEDQVIKGTFKAASVMLVKTDES